MDIKDRMKELFVDRVEVKLYNNDYECYFYADKVCSRKLKMQIVGFNEKLDCIILSTSEIDGDRYDKDYFWTYAHLDESDKVFVNKDEIENNYFIYAETNEIFSIEDSFSSYIDFKTILLDFIYDKSSSYITIEYMDLLGIKYKLEIFKDIRADRIVEIKKYIKYPNSNSFSVEKTEKIKYNTIIRKKKLGRYIHDLFKIQSTGVINVKEHRIREDYVYEYSFILK